MEVFAMKRLSALTACALLGTLLATGAWAQADMGFRAAGFEIGIVGPDNTDAAVGLRLFTDLGTVYPNIALQTHVGFWSSSEDLGFLGKTSVRDIIAGARARYMFEVSNPQFQPFAGAGLGLHFLRAEVTIPDQDIGGIIVPGFSVSDTSTKLGLDIGGGTMLNLNEKAGLVGELWYTFVSDVGQLSAHVGFVYFLPY
jgi:hypothetical protein